MFCAGRVGTRRHAFTPSTPSYGPSVTSEERASEGGREGGRERWRGNDRLCSSKGDRSTCPNRLSPSLPSSLPLFSLPSGFHPSAFPPSGMTTKSCRALSASAGIYTLMLIRTRWEGKWGGREREGGREGGSTNSKEIGPSPSLPEDVSGVFYMALVSMMLLSVIDTHQLFRHGHHPVSHCLIPCFLRLPSYSASVLIVARHRNPEIRRR